MSRIFRYYTDITVDEDDIRRYLDLDEDDEITNDMYQEVAYQKFLAEDCEYFDYEK